MGRLFPHPVGVFCSIPNPPQSRIMDNIFVFRKTPISSNLGEVALCSVWLELCNSPAQMLTRKKAAKFKICRPHLVISLEETMEGASSLCKPETSRRVPLTKLEHVREPSMTQRKTYAALSISEPSPYRVDRTKPTCQDFWNLERQRMMHTSKRKRSTNGSFHSWPLKGLHAAHWLQNLRYEAN